MINRTGSDVRARRVVSVVATPVADGALWLVASLILSSDITANTGGQARAVTLVSVVATALLAGLAGTVVVLALEAKSSRPQRTWLIISVTVLVVSLAGPLMATQWSSGVVLVLMHLLTGAILIPGLMPMSAVPSEYDHNR